MAAEVTELFENRHEVIGESAEIPYGVLGAEDEAAVRAAAESEIPATMDSSGVTLALKSVELVEHLDVTTWRLRAKYRKSSWNWFSHLTPPDPRFSFDTSGGTQHITQSRETVNSYGPKKSDELGGAIGFDGKTVQGCDIVVPVYNWAETHYFEDADITSAYKQIIAGLTGKTNNASFKGFDEGEVLFLGATGSRQGDDDDDLWEITFRFAASPNETDLEVGDIAGIAKWGWEYLWVQYGDTEDAVANLLVKSPVAVYIERVYDAGDFSDLNIGT